MLSSIMMKKNIVILSLFCCSCVQERIDQEISHWQYKEKTPMPLENEPCHFMIPLWSKKHGLFDGFIVSPEVFNKNQHKRNELNIDKRTSSGI